MIHYLLLLGSLECSGINRRVEANTPATLTATERGVSTWHLFLFISLSVACSATSTAVSSIDDGVSALARPGWLMSLWLSGTQLGLHTSATERMGSRAKIKGDAAAGSVVVKNEDCDDDAPGTRNQERQERWFHFSKLISPSFIRPCRI